LKGWLVMKGGRFVLATWTAEHIRIHWQSGMITSEFSISHNTASDWRYFLNLHHLKDGSFLLRSGDEKGTLFYRATSAGDFIPVADFPKSLALLPPNQVIPRDNGMIAGMLPNESQLILWTPGRSLEARELPPGFLIRDLAWDRLNRLWICGASPTDKFKSLNYRRTLAVSDDDGVSWQVRGVPHRGLKVAWRSLFSQAEATYRKVFAVDGSLVLTCETEDPGHTSTFFFIRDAREKWRSGILESEVLRTALPAPPDKLELICHYGRSVKISSTGKFRSSSLVPRINARIRRVAEDLPTAAQYEILSARPTPDGGCILIVSVRLPSDDGLKRGGEAVVLLGSTRDELVAFNSPEQPEIVSACSY